MYFFYFDVLQCTSLIIIITTTKKNNNDNLLNAMKSNIVLIVNIRGLIK